MTAKAKTAATCDHCSAPLVPWDRTLLDEPLLDEDGQQYELCGRCRKLRDIRVWAEAVLYESDLSNAELFDLLAWLRDESAGVDRLRVMRTLTNLTPPEPPEER